MAQVINTNSLSLLTQNNLNKSQSSLSSAICNQVNHLIPTRVLVKGGEITCKILK